MRLFAVRAALACAVFLAACSGSSSTTTTPPPVCGGVSEPCCAGNTCGVGVGLACVQGTCVVPGPCGGASQACCAGATCGAGLACQANVCVAAGPACTAPFAEAGDVALPFAPESLEAADVDGDGKLDLVAAGGSANLVAVLKGKGDGTFAAPVTYAASAPIRVAVADLDGDGHLDIATVGGSTVTLLFGPTFASTTMKRIAAGTALQGIAAADIDGDGKIDLVVTDASYAASNVVVLLNQGNKTFGAQTYAAGAYPHGVAIGDLNGDGIPDVVAADYYVSSGTGWSCTVAVLLGKGGGAFAPAVLYPSGLNSIGVAIGDLDGDGKPDLAVANYADGNPADVQILHGNGDGSFASAASYPTGSKAYDVRLADLNGDGRLDVVAPAYGSASASVLLTGAIATAFGSLEYAVGGGPTAAVPGDFDGDGHLDLAVASFLDHSVRILRGAVGGTFPAPHVTRTGNEPYAMAAGELNGDGRLDLVVAERGAGIAALLGKGDGTFARSLVAAGSPVFVTLADVNGDRKLDALWSDGMSTVGVLLGAGDGTFTAQPSLGPGSGSQPIAIATGDLNGDGKVDAVVTTYTGASVFLGNGDGTFVAGAPVALPAAMSAAASRVALVDLDGDGKLDLVAGGYDLYVAKGNGDGTFQTPTARGDYSVADLVVADLNGDGAPDLAAAFPTVYTGPKVKAFPNQSGALGYGVGTDGPASPSSIAAGDLNGDGKVDVAVTGGSSGDLLEIFLGKGDLTFPWTEILHAGDGVADVVLGDFDGDGRLDAAVLSTYDDSVRVLPNRCP